MYINGIDFPNQIINAIKEDKLVVFVGAGASRGKPTNLPDFKKLTEKIAEGTGEKRKRGEPCEVFLGRLKHKDINVNELVAQQLSKKDLKPNKLHKYLVNLFPNQKNIKIVTTNYDNMLEKAIEDIDDICIKIYDDPALPLGNDVRGIVHVHGNVNEPEYMVVTDEDFGKAYLSDGYVSRFLVKLFENYTVLFVGYSYNDVIVRYLTRAITKNRVMNRYVLTNSEKGNWDELGIEPIVFENGNFDVLYESINQLGTIVKRGLLDWNQKLKIIAEKPPLDLTIESEVLFCLEDDSHTRLLIKAIHGKEWLLWLDKKGIFDNLFLPNNNLSTIEQEWSDWICKEFLKNDHQVILELVTKHSNEISKSFIYKLVNCITGENIEYSEKTVREMVMLSLKYVDNVWELSRLYELAMRSGLHDLGWSIFKHFYDYKMILRKEMVSLKENDIVFVHTFLTDYYTAEMAWEQYEEIYIKNNSGDILEFVKNLILSIHYAYVNVGSATEKNEPYRFCAIQIEEDEPNYDDDEPLSILFKAVSKICLALINVDKEYVKRYIIQCIISESLILRKLGLKLLRETELYTSVEKKRILLSKISIYAIGERTQIFKLVAKIFDDLQERDKKEIIGKINKGTTEYKEEHNEYLKYNWLVWINMNCKVNKYVDSLLSEVMKKNPDFEPSEYPHLNWHMTVESGCAMKSPISKDIMLDMEIDMLIQELVSFEGDRWKGPSREGLLIVFSNCIKDNYEWADKMQRNLLEKSIVKLDVWEYYFNGVLKSEFTTEQLIKILNVSVEHCINENNEKILSDIMLKCIELNNTKKNFEQYRDDLHKICLAIWKTRSDCDANVSSSVAVRCLNCTTGILMSCWIYMLSYENEGFPSKYKDFFENSLKEKKEIDQIICVLAGRINFLYTRDRIWCKEKIFPLLSSVKHSRFVAAWVGMNWLSSSISTELANDILDVYLVNIERIHELEDDAKRGFVERYALLMVYIVGNPIKKYIPALFKVADDDDKVKFASTICRCIKEMDMQHKNKLWQSWLQQYVINRIYNKLHKLSENETLEMLNWALYMDKLYPEYVKILTSGMNISSVGVNFFYALNKSELIHCFPEDTAQLIIYLLRNTKIEAYQKTRLKNIADKITNISRETQRELDEVLLQFGL